jgi:amidase
VFGLKPQRDRVPMAPREDAWHGLAVNGPIARTVADAGLFLDATSVGASPIGGFAAAAEGGCAPLRIAVSRKAPPASRYAIGPEQLRALEQTEEILRHEGHQVSPRDIEYPKDALAQVAVRYLCSIHDDVRGMARPELVGRRVRALSRYGGVIPRALLRLSRRRERALTASVDALFVDHDVLLTPGPVAGPWLVGELDGRGALATLSACAERIPFQGIFNATGHPACSVPAGFDADGLPVGVQLVGRARDETTLLRLSAQLEAARPWNRRPTLALPMNVEQADGAQHRR